MSYSDLPGNNKIKTVLKRLVKNKVLSRAILLVGDRLSFKNEIGFELSKALHCKEETGESCEVCKHCRLVEGITELEKISEGETKSSHPDFLMIIPKSDLIKIDEVRNIKKFVHSRPMISDKKVILIQTIEKMNIQAQNAFLKTLEEPNKYIYFIITSQRPDLVLSTIKSRCQIIYLKRVLKETIGQHYNIKDKELLDLMLKSGKPFNKIDREEVIKNKLFKDLITKIILENQPGKIIELKEEMDKISKPKHREKIRILTSSAIEVLRAILVIKLEFYNDFKDKNFVQGIKNSEHRWSEVELKNKILYLEKIEQDSYLNVKPDILFTGLIQVLNSNTTEISSDYY